jgi:hypothetical protein
MSHSCDIRVKIGVRKQSFLALIRHLLSTGWSLDNGQAHVSFCLEDAAGELFDWQGLPLADVDEVLRCLQQQEEQGRSFALEMTRPNENETATFLFFPQRNSIHMAPSRGRRILAGAEPFTDFSHHLSKLLGPLISSGCSIDGVECIDLP